MIVIKIPAILENVDKDQERDLVYEFLYQLLENDELEYTIEETL